MGTIINTANATEVLIARSATRSLGAINSILITNTSTNDADPALVDLYLEKVDTSKYYFIKNVSIPHGIGLFINDNFLGFDNKVYSLNIKNDGSNRGLTITIK